MAIQKKHWGYADNKDVYLFTISNGLLNISVTNYGCTIVSVDMTNTNGIPVNLVLGYSSLQHYVNDPYYIGCVVGRFANRISNAGFYIADQQYNLTANENGKNHLHGGIAGFNKKVFRIGNVTEDAVQFLYSSPDGEEGYPGNLEVSVSYQLTSKNELILTYYATTDKSTPVSLTNHSYFNLGGNTEPVLQHELLINSDTALVMDKNYIPTGATKTVENTTLDFRKWRMISDSDTESFEGFNECYSMNMNEKISFGAALRDPYSQRSMTMRTSLPGLMLYTGDYLKTPFHKNQGVCLETQFFPDSPNQSTFLSALLHPGQVYKHETVYQFFNYFID